jgi:hypothetical protein
MSSRFPDNDTFSNHFEDLLLHFQPPKNITWAQVLVVEQQSITGRKPELIPKSAMISADKYENRFDELLNMGYDWINMHAKGILQEAFIVQIEYPLKSINAPRHLVSVNYSGPASNVWDLSDRVMIVE